MRIFWSLAAATAIFGATAGNSIAQTRPGMMSLLVHPGSNIHVSKCEPMQGSTFVTPGFVPAYYPAGQFWWYDAYGRRFYQPSVTRTSPQLAIDYRNTGAKVAKTIEFGLVARGHLVAEVRDVGTFSPGAEIKHTFGLSPNVFPLGTSLAQCVPLRITYEDGTHWRSLRLPALMSSR
ncbi:MAG: hypothetical protein JO193_08040 [Candidatus Eremiobacteraeota bacterium]|nr:hypothetical protein [Candidatus Eremiobacteraeota bacterium]